MPKQKHATKGAPCRHEKGAKRRIDLRTLQANPMRDFLIDPYDEETVTSLRQSIAEDGFWGGIVCRKLPDGTLQIGAGHHRVKAALAEGITTADVFVGEAMDDASMVRVYARENATQRGQNSTALTGAVAAALRYVAKAILTGSDEKFFTSFHLPTLRERLLEGEGVGRKVLVAFLENIPGINAGSIQQQLANLKTSGDYARLMAGVEADIARDHPDAMEAIAAAREAARKAAEQPKTFDFEGVARYLKNPYQVDVFRAEVTSEAIRRSLPLDQQAPLAAQLVALAAEYDHHVSGEFIRREISRILLEEDGNFAAFIRRERERLEQEYEDYALERAVERFERHITGLGRAGRRITTLLREWPGGKEVPTISYDLRVSIYETLQILTTLHQDGRFAYEPEEPFRSAQPQTRPQVSPPRRRLGTGSAHRE